MKALAWLWLHCALNCAKVFANSTTNQLQDMIVTNGCGMENPCTQLCTNMGWGNECGCKTGWQLGDDGVTCYDINECLLRNGHGPCEDVCQNTEGSYTCSCSRQGATLSADGHTCEYEDVCVVDNGRCSHTCITAFGKVFCACPDGMILDTDLKTCIDKPQGDQPRDEYYGENTVAEYIDGGEVEDYETYDEDSDEQVDDNEEQNKEEEEEVEEKETYVMENKHEEEHEKENVEGIDQTTSYNSLMEAVLEKETRIEYGVGSNEVIDIDEDITENENTETSTEYKVDEDTETDDTESDVETITEQGVFVEGITEEQCHHECKETGFLVDVESNIQETAETDQASSVEFETTRITEVLTDAQVTDNIVYETTDTITEQVEENNEENLTNLDISTTSIPETTQEVGVEVRNNISAYEDDFEEYDENYDPNKLFRIFIEEDVIVPTDPTTNAPTTMCASGFRHNAMCDCVDIDECRDMEHGCSDGCENTIGSYNCVCPPGYETTIANPYTCTDIDECALDICSHGCINLRGSFQCVCPEGLVLNRNNCECPSQYELVYDRKSCQRTNPCLIGNGGCSHFCHFSEASEVIFCTCPQGYQLAEVDLRTCEEINPCLVENGGCSHFCAYHQNTVHCACPEHLQLVGNVCEKRNLCQDNNGGCSHFCNFINDTIICQCPNNEQFMLIGKECVRRNPCLINNGGCSHSCFVDFDSQPVCVCPMGHTIDSTRRICKKETCDWNNGGCAHICEMQNDMVRCACRQGYELQSNGTSCRDVNECMYQNGRCSQICRNLQGSYQCLCQNGYQLSSDGHTCAPTRNGCQVDNGGCDHICEDSYPNGHKCSCIHGYELQKDAKSCVEISICECPIEIPQFGRIKCTTAWDKFVPVGAECQYICDRGYTLIGKAVRICESTGDWDYPVPFCKAVQTCPKLAHPLQGRVIPHICSVGKTTIGQSCMVHCRAGYKLSTDTYRNFTCGDDLQWSIDVDKETLRNACVPIDVPKPFIRCPGGGLMTFILNTGEQSTLVRIPRPSTNVDWWRYVTSTPNWGKQLSKILPPGRFHVQFTATSPTDPNVKVSCLLIIHVKDEEAPKVCNCPSNQEVRLKQGELTAKVYWQEPTFEDNIGIRTLYKSNEPGAQFPYGLHHVNYIASDDAGNRAYCHFSINVVSYYHNEHSSRRGDTASKYRAVLICPNENTNDNAIQTQNDDCKWTHIQTRATQQETTRDYHQKERLPKMDIPYQVPGAQSKRRNHFDWCC